DGKEFELALADLYRAKGYIVIHTGQSNDGGVDLKLLNGQGKKIIVQAKAYKSKVGREEVQQLFGVFVNLQQKGMADEAWLITTIGFTDHAAFFARGKPISLITVQDVLSKNVPQATDQETMIELCPRCDGSGEFVPYRYRHRHSGFSRGLDGGHSFACCYGCSGTGVPNKEYRELEEKLIREGLTRKEAGQRIQQLRRAVRMKKYGLDG
ncbi:MAG TPA: restriction endonuclease, partial [Candidatus Saccharimonadales bacterium]|nr:restriction endonuclease [Candidatus Saccharimonadales bacterium]